MNILIIGYVWPEPKSSAAGYNIVSLLKLLKQQGWQLTFSSPAIETPHMEDLAELGIQTHPIELNSDCFNDFVAQLTPDVVIFDRFMMEEQFGWRVEKYAPNAIRLLNTEDLFTIRKGRHAALKQNRVTQVPYDYFNDHARREIAAIFRSDCALIISTYELSILKQYFNVSDALMHYMPFRLSDHDALKQENITFKQRQHFITIGNFRHDPNWDAVLWLKQAIWPLIREHFKARNIPCPQLHIYGSYPPPKATQLHDEKTGFLIKGWADDAYQVMREAKVCLAPLRFGAGLKGKLADAMLCGTPNVTTAIGAEAMHGTQDWSGLIGHTAEELAEHATTLYLDEVVWQNKQVAGYSIIKNEFNSEEIGARLIDRLNDLVATREDHRKQNFIGSMLNHHSMKSTQYMSQWIAEKNKNK